MLLLKCCPSLTPTKLSALRENARRRKVQILRSPELESLDKENLIEELQALVRGVKSTVESLTINILTHLIYCQYWTECNRTKPHWQAKITIFRFQLENHLSKNLENHLLSRWDILLSKAVKIASLKTQLSLPNITYSFQQVRDEDFFP